MITRLAGLPRRGVSTRSCELLERSDLAALDVRVAEYSGGVRWSLDSACALGPNPQVVILDECITGLDADGRTELWSIVREIIAAGTTVMLTTQYLEEADPHADPVAVHGGGEIAALGAPGELKRVSVMGGLATPFASVSGYSKSGGSAAGSTSIVPPDVEDAAVELPRIESVVARNRVGVVSALSSEAILDEAIVRITFGGGP